MNRPAASFAPKNPRLRPRFVVSAAAVAVILATFVFLTGCNVSTGVDTTVDADGSGTVGMRLVADKELQDALSGAAGGLGDQAGPIPGILGDLGGLTGGLPASADDLFNLIVGQIPGDWKAERGTDSSGARWLTLTRPFSSPEELQQVLSGRFLSTVISTDQFSLHQDKGFFTTKTVYSATADAGSVTSRAHSAAGFTRSILGDVLTVENRLTLPGAIDDNNADEVQGNTLVWDVGVSGPKEMHAASTVYNWGAIIGIAIAGVLVIAGVTVAVILLVRRRRKPSPEPPAAVQPPSPPSLAEASPSAQDETPSPAEPDQADKASTTADGPGAMQTGVAAAPIAGETEAIEAAPAADEAASAPAAAAPAAAPAAVEAAQSALKAGQTPPSGPAAVQAATAAAATSAAAAPPPVADAPRPVVPIPLRPTKAQPDRTQ